MKTKILTLLLMLGCCGFAFSQATDGICDPATTVNDVDVTSTPNPPTTACSNGTNVPTFGTPSGSLPDGEYVIEVNGVIDDINATGTTMATPIDGDVVCLSAFTYDLAAIDGLLTTANNLCGFLDCDAQFGIPGIEAAIADLVNGVNDGTPGLNSLQEALDFAASFGTPITTVGDATTTLDGLNTTIGGFGLGPICYATSAPVCYTIDDSDPACAAPACELTSVTAAAPVCSADGATYTVEVTVAGTDASVTLDDAASVEVSQAAAAGVVTFTYAAGTAYNITVNDTETLCVLGPFVGAAPACGGGCTVDAGEPTPATADVCIDDIGAVDVTAVFADPGVVGTPSLNQNYVIVDPTNANDIITVSSTAVLDLTGLVVGDQACVTSVAYTQETLDIVTAFVDAQLGNICVPIVGPCASDFIGPFGTLDLSGFLNGLNGAFETFGFNFTSDDIALWCANQEITLPLSAIPGGLFPDLVIDLTTIPGLEPDGFCCDFSTATHCLTVIDCAVCPIITAVDAPTDGCDLEVQNICVTYDQDPTGLVTADINGVVGVIDPVAFTICYDIPLANTACDPAALDFVHASICIANSEPTLDAGGADTNGSIGIVNVYPQYEVVVVPPVCDGVAGSAEVQVNGVACATPAPVAGTAGVTNVCPAPAPGTPATLVYDFSADANIVAATAASCAPTGAALTGDISTLCDITCNGCDITDITAGAPVCSADGMTYDVTVTVMGADASVMLDDGTGPVAAVTTTFTFNSGAGYTISVTDSDVDGNNDPLCAFGPFTGADPACPTTPAEFTFGISDPCACADDETAANAADGTFTEVVTVWNDINMDGVVDAGEGLPLGAIITVANQSGMYVTGNIGATAVGTADLVPLGTALVATTVNGENVYTISFNHVNNQGYTITVDADINADAVSDGTATISNLCTYPSPVIMEFTTDGTCFELDGAVVTLNGMDANGSALAAENFTVNGVATNVIDPAALGMGMYVVTYEYTATADGNNGVSPDGGITPAAPGCTATIETTIEISESCTVENIPTVGEWGLIILGLMMSITAIVGIRQRREEETYA